VSRIIPERRLDELLRAFARVVKSVPQARLIVVGDGPQRRQSELLARSLNIDRKVSFVGSPFGKAKIEVLKTSHILAHPSIKEGMSLTIYESLACRTPVVAYDIPEVKEQLDLTGGGVLVRTHDIEGFANTILT
jgi:glycosyltransferase involved in cell wall biosynthesis